MFSDLKKHVENYYVLKKSEYTRTVTTVQRLLLNHQPSYNSNRKPQSKFFSNQIMFAQHEKTGYDNGETNDNKQTAK